MEMQSYRGRGRGRGRGRKGGMEITLWCSIGVKFIWKKPHAI
jgi:hypothetical protein